MENKRVFSRSRIEEWEVMPRELIVIGDRVLIEPDEGEGKTDAGLYLPQTVREKEKVQGGFVVRTGPGYPIPDPSALEAEPWKTPDVDQAYFPLQAMEGDYCVFLRSAAIEIEFERKKYVIVPHSAILVLMREELSAEDGQAGDDEMGGRGDGDSR